MECACVCGTALCALTVQWRAVYEQCFSQLYTEPDRQAVKQMTCTHNDTTT